MNHRYCPKCNESLKVVTVGSSVKVKPGDRNEELAVDENMKVYQTQFICPKCRLKYTIDDLRRIERVNKMKE
jgi:uncharacterized protein YbaR (Trm112 family)